MKSMLPGGNKLLALIRIFTVLEARVLPVWLNPFGTAVEALPLPLVAPDFNGPATCMALHVLHRGPKEIPDPWTGLKAGRSRSPLETQ